MSLKDYSHKELKKTPMLELAGLLLLDEKKAMDFNDIFSRVTEIKEYEGREKEKNIAQFYTDMNVDGRFMTVGSNMWGLKRWYPVEQMDEEIVSTPKKKKKKKKTATKAAVKDTDKNQEEEEELTLNTEELDIVDEDIDEMVDELDDDDFDDDEVDETDDDTDDSEDDEDEGKQR